MANRLHLSGRHRRAIEALLRKHLPGVEAWAYGSRVNGRSHDGSDLDLLLRGSGLAIIPADQLADFLEAVQESTIPFLVEARDWARVPEQFHKEIERNHVVLAGRGRDSLSRETLGDYFNLQRGTTYKSRLLGQDGPVLLGLASIQRNGGFRTDSLRTYGGECPNKLLVHPGELYVSLKDVTQSADLLGAVARLPENHPPGRLTQDTVKLVPKRNSPPIEYIHWLLRTPEYRHYCLARATGTTNLGLPRDDFLAYPVPPLTLSRRRIVEALKGLDDKIELNRRENETLEALSRAIFKDWFVDFGPTHAKAEGREPYLRTELWNLFPDELDDGKPAGWRRKPLDGIAEFLNGVALQKFPVSDPDDSLPVIKIAELRGGVTAKSGRASRRVPASYVVRDGDFLFSWSGSLLAKFWTGGEGALNQHLFKVTSDRYPAWFFSQWVSHHLGEFQAIAATKATTMGHIKREHLKQAMTTCPPDDVLATLGKTLEPLVDRAVENALQSRTLAQTRDLLLPKLIVGDLRVGDAETLVNQLS